MLDVDAPGDMAAVRRVLESRRGPPFVLHFAPSSSLMVRGAVASDDEVRPATFRPTRANLNVMTEILDAVFAVEPNVLHQAYVGPGASSGVKVLGSMDGEMHRIDDAMPPVEWSITAEQKEHLGYSVTVAIGEVRGERVEAWFAPDIPVSGGPALFGGLPGMILVLSLNEGRITYSAAEVSLDGVRDGLIQTPTVGEARSEEEYRSIVTDHVREFIGGIRPMVRTYREVKCTVGLPGRLVQCMQVRGDSSGGRWSGEVVRSSACRRVYSECSAFPPSDGDSPAIRVRCGLPRATGKERRSCSPG